MEQQSADIRRATGAERDIITAHFKDNEILLKSLRALFLGLPITDEEKAAIRALPQNLKAIIWDRFLPQLDRESPIGQVKDVWLGVEQMVFAQPPHVIEQAIQYKERAVDMTHDALKLMDGEGNVINLEYSSKLYPNDHNGVILLARNQFIRHIESQLNTLWVIANLKEEKPVETAKRMHRDSAK